MDQLDPPKAVSEAPAHDRNLQLAGIHAVAQWAVQTPEFAHHIATSVASGRHGSAFDEVLRDRLTANPTGWRRVDVVGLGRVERVRWGRPPTSHQRGGRSLCDLTLHIDELVVPVNVKRAAGPPRWNHACAALTAWHLVLTGSMVPREPVDDLAAARMALRAGHRKLVSAEYLILHVQDGAAVSWTIQGLVGSVRADGSLASRLNPTTGRILYASAAGVIRPDANIERMLADAWGPRAVSPAQMRELLWVDAARRYPSAPAKLETFARLLESLDGDELFNRWVWAVTTGTG